MSKLALSIVAAFVLLATATAPVAAAGGPQPTAPDLEPHLAQSQDQNQTSAGQVGEQIDGELALVSSSYNPSAGTVTLTFEAASARAVTLSDAGGFIDGGEINRRTLVAQPGRSTVEFAVTQTRQGYVGVSIATEDVLYAEVIRSPSLSPFQGSSGTVGWFGGAGIVLVSFVGAAGWKLYKEGGEPVEADL